MRRVMNSKLAVPLIILPLLVIVIFALVIRWHKPPEVAGEQPDRTSPARATGSTPTAVTQPAGLAGWARPTTTDPLRYAVAFGTAIWTYDSTVHTYSQWEDAVTAFVNPLQSPAAGEVARSMLPYVSQWDELKTHNARASVLDAAAATTPELQALAKDPRVPAGWHGLVVRGTQVTVVDGEKTQTVRHVTIGVICRPRCTFWSASNELPK